MTKQASPPSWPRAALAGCACLAGLLVLSRYNYLLFHSISEFLCAMVAGSVFAVSLNSRRFQPAGYPLLLGAGYLAVAGFDLLHTLAIPAMGVFGRAAGDLTVALWLAGRLLEAGTLLAAGLVLGRRVAVAPLAAVYGVVSALILTGLFAWPAVPALFAPGPGPAAARLAVESLVGAALLGAGLAWWKRRDRIQAGTLRLLLTAMACTAAGELFFIVHLQWNYLPGSVGLLCKLASYLVLYRALVAEALQRPYVHLFDQMAEQSRRLEAILKAAPIGVWLIGTDRRIKLTNPALCRLLGYSREELVGKDARILYADQAEYRRIGRDKLPLLASHGGFRTETVFAAKDGGILPVRVDSAPLKPDYPEQGAISTVTDLTELKQAQLRLAESERRFRGLFHEAPMGYQSLDQEGNFLEVNQAWLDLLGYRREEVLGRNFGEFLAPEWLDHFRENFPRFKAVGEVLGVEFEMVRKDGERILVQFHGRVGRKADGSFKQTHCVLNDITRSRAAEETRAELEREERQSLKFGALATLSGGVAHEFNNILAAITGYTELALEEAQRGQARPSYLRHILDSSLRARNLVRRILAMGGGLGLKLASLPLNQTLAKTLPELFRHLPAGVRGVFEPGAKTGELRADYSLLNSALAALLDNSALAMPHGGLVTVSTAREEVNGLVCSACGAAFFGEMVRISVKDSGQGMDRETVARALDPFFTTREVGQGAGLGLALVFGAAKNHGGHLILESQPGQGAEVHMYLPAVPAASLFAQRHKSREEKSFLLVDDDPGGRRLAQSILTGAGYRVTAVGDGMEALRLADDKGTKMDGVLLDLDMPQLDGAKVLAELKRMRPGIKVIMTGHFPAADGAALFPEADGFLAKPLVREELLAAAAGLFS